MNLENIRPSIENIIKIEWTNMILNSFLINDQILWVTIIKIGCKYYDFYVFYDFFLKLVQCVMNCYRNFYHFFRFSKSFILLVRVGGLH